MTSRINSCLAPVALLLLVCTTLPVGTTLAVAADQGTKLQVFILAGQSNMAGQGVVSMDHPKYYNAGKGNLVWSMEHSASKDKMQHLRDADGKWVVRDDVEISFKARGKVRKGRLTVGYTSYGGSSHIGPELQFGHVMGDYFEEPVLLIKTAWGGKSLYKDFRPPSSSGEVGPYYTQMIQEIREALKALGDRRIRDPRLCLDAGLERHVYRTGRARIRRQSGESWQRISAGNSKCRSFPLSLANWAMAAWQSQAAACRNSATRKGVAQKRSSTRYSS